VRKIGAPREARSSATVKFQFDSHLYTRYNGAMLGFFLDGAHLRGASDRYATLRQRMVEFLAELGIEIVFPMTHAEYRVSYPELRVKIVQETVKASPLLGAFTALASAVMDHAMDPRGAITGGFPRKALDFMERQGISRTVLDTVAKQIQPPKDGSIPLRQLHTAALVFVNEILTPLSQERDTAFVAMPFSRRFRGNFPTLYAPLLRELDYRAIRAWGGLADEDYQEVVLTLISKCGVLLADVTTRAPNVLHEVGVAQGQNDILLVLVAEKNRQQPPSNLGNLMVFPYEREGRNWQRVAVFGLAALIAIADEYRSKGAGAGLGRRSRRRR